MPFIYNIIFYILKVIIICQFLEKLLIKKSIQHYNIFLNKKNEFLENFNNNYSGLCNKTLFYENDQSMKPIFLTGIHQK